MKWRDPGTDAERHMLLLEQRQAHAATLTLRIVLMTPMLGGGTEAGVPDPKMPARASAIRGQLRWWWRFLASRQTDMLLPSVKLFKEECEIWGGMAEPGKDLCSKVRIRIQDVSNCHLDRYRDAEPKYALFPAREQRGNEPRQARDLVRPGMAFTLSIVAQDQQLMEEQVKPALRWWLTFGGLGARTRRGCGSLFCPTQKPVTVEEARAAGCQLVFFNKGRKGHPIDSENEKDRIDAWEKAWKQAIDCLSAFRQSPGTGRNGSHQHPGRSHWPEADSIRELMGTHSDSRRGDCNTHVPEHPARIAFPRAAFGLPIVFKFKDDRHGDPQQTELVPSGAERMPSPLILTPYCRVENKTCVAAALLLPQRLLAGKPLELKGYNSELDWWAQDKALLVAPIRDYQGNDALEAFLNFFAQGGSQP